MSPRLMRSIGGFCIGWSIITVIDVLKHAHQPSWMWSLDVVFFVVAVYSVIQLLKPTPPSQ